jgi:nucleotide-binding universal stress UspA family protein
MTRRILVAVHDSDSSRETARVVRELFERDTVEILGVNVAHQPLQWIAPGIGYGMVFPAFPVLDANGERTIDVERQEQAREQAAHVMDEAGIDDALAIGALGDAVTAIVNAADDNDVDVIAVGGDDAGFLERLLHGSVSRTLLQESDRPVLVVPSPPADADR